MRVDLPDGRKFTFYFKHLAFFQPKKGGLWHRSSPPSKYPRSTLCAINQDNPEIPGAKRTWTQKTFSYAYWNLVVEPQYRGHEIARRRSLVKALARGGFTREERRAFWDAYWGRLLPKAKKDKKKVGLPVEEKALEGVGA